VPLLLLACFFLSGATGLLFEVVWTRQLGHVLGSDTLAISTVLATFMGGLALGSWLGGRIADRLRRDPLLYYAGCEAGIALLALAIPWVIGQLPPVNVWLWIHFGEWPLVLSLLRFVLCAVLLLPPTALMGATLPLLARRVVSRPEDFGQLGRRIGALYAANTAGAVAGAGAAGFYFIPTIGVSATNWTAVLIDLALALAIAAAIAIRTRSKVPPPPHRGRGGSYHTAQVDSNPDPDNAVNEDVLEIPLPQVRSRRTALLAFSLSGFVAMTMEVLCSRALSFIIGSSIYSFTLVLVVFLLGLSAGAAWIGRPAARSRDPLGVLSIVFLFSGLSIALAHLVLDDLPRVFLALLETSSIDVGTILSLQGLLCGITLLPTAACLGAVMPLCVRAYAGSPDAVGRDVGRAYAANTVGAILGSFAGGFIVLPIVGLETGIRACAVADLLLASLLGALAIRARIRRAAPAIAAVLAAAALISPAWNTAVLTSGVFRMTLARRFIGHGSIYTPEMLYYRDGRVTTVTVEKHGENLALKNNGKTEASSRGDMPTQILVGLVPVLLHGGETQRVAVVGYGSGVTVGAIAEAPEVARVDVIELEPAIYEAADRFFSPYNHEPQHNPKVHRFVGDGRNFLTAKAERYDVIVSEPSNPWIAGVASLFTREFYRFAKQHLAPGGVFCQWAQLYELGPRNVKMIYRTFREAFPYVYAFSAADLSADTILVGSDQPLSFDLARLRARFADPRLGAELRRGGARSAEDLIGMLILAPDEVPAFSAGAEVNTDDNALLEFSAPRDLIGAIRGIRFADSIYHVGWPYGHLDEIVTGASSGAGEAQLALALLAHGKRREAIAWLARARASGADTARIERLSELARMRDVSEEELPLVAGGPPLFAPPSGWSEPRAPAEAITWDLHLVWAYALYKTLDFERAEAQLADLARIDKAVRRRPAIRYYLGRVRYGQGKFQEGTDELLRFMDEFPAIAGEVK
jgi:spermidine synthase